MDVFKKKKKNLIFKFNFFFFKRKYGPFGSTKLLNYYSKIPDDTNILITHVPPMKILDVAWRKNVSIENCEICGDDHKNFEHWGCSELLKTVLEKRPDVHCFGY